MRSNKTKEEIYLDAFALFVTKPMPNELFINYMNDEDGEATFELQCWIVNNMRTEIIDWCTGIGIIEAVEHLYKVAEENGNLKKIK